MSKMPPNSGSPFFSAFSATELATAAGDAGATGGVVGRLSMSGAGVVAQVGVNGATTLRLYNPSTGALVHSRYVRSNAKLINASGARALYRVGNDIHIFNLLTGQTHLVYRSPRPLGTLRLDGRMIVWLGSGTAVMGIKLSPIPG